MKICSNCLYMDGPSCNRPVGVNRVTGAVKTCDESCNYERSVPIIFSYFTGNCGKQARFFKAKD